MVVGSSWFFIWLTVTALKLVLEKAEESKIKLPTSAGSLKKQESSRKTSISALLTMPKPLTVWPWNPYLLEGRYLVYGLIFGVWTELGPLKIHML